MHINLNRITQQLDEEESLHLEECQHCRDEYTLLVQLQMSAEEIQLLTPNQDNWQAIEKRISIKANKQSKRPIVSYSLMATAASVLFMAGGWLFWSNYQLQIQLEQVLLVNNHLEEKLNQLGGGKFGASTAFIQVLAIEDKLKVSTSVKEQTSLLKQREKHLRKIINTKESGEYEYSI